MATRALQVNPDICKNIRKLTRKQFAEWMRLVKDEKLSDDDAFLQMLTNEGYTLNATGTAYVKQEVA
ncbi:MAG TPA: hypothetical protein V6D26_30710 [Stenomitos sp.]